MATIDVNEYQAVDITRAIRPPAMRGAAAIEDRVSDLQDAHGETIEAICKCLYEVGAKLGVNTYRDSEPMNGDPLNLRERQRAQLETLRHAAEVAVRIANAI